MHNRYVDLFEDTDHFDHAKLMEVLKALSDTYSCFELTYLGSSILGRGIPLIRVGRGKREVLYVGAHHGMEWITSMLLCKFLQETCELFSQKATIYRHDMEMLLQTHTIYLVPMLNPDGVEYQTHGVKADNPMYDRLLKMNRGSENFSSWQANARGVDLNHNYDAGFSEYKQLEAENDIISGAPTRYSGENPESEPEVIALCNFIRFHKGLRGILTLHTQGEEIFYKRQERNAPHIEHIARHLSAVSGYRLSQAVGLASYGGLSDWCADRLALPSFTVECGKGVNPLPISDFFPIYVRIREILFRFPTML